MLPYHSLLSQTWLPPMRLTYSCVYSYENKYNLIGGNALNNLKKKISQFSTRLLVYSHQNNIKKFWYYSHNILIRLLRSKKDRRNICYFWRQFNENKWKKQSYVIFELDNVGKKRRDYRNVTILICILLKEVVILASLKFKSGNTVKSTKSNLKETELKAVVRWCSSK